MHEHMNFPCMKMAFSCIKMKFCSSHDIFPPDVFMGNWAVHDFMHRILTHENFGANSSFSCMTIQSINAYGIQPIKLNFHGFQVHIFAPYTSGSSA